MVSRLRRPFPLLLLAISAVIAAACQKVPLLAPSGSTITLTAAATALPANGSTDIIAQVIESSGTPPHSGTRITFTTNLGTVQPSEAETDAAGRVVVKFIAGSGSGTATISAISGGVSASGTNAIKIAVGSAAVGSITLGASPTSLPASGGSSTISAIVNDTSGNVLGGVSVNFSTDTGSLSPSVVTTDASGRAQSVLTTSRTAKVTATAGVPTTSGTTVTPAATNTVTVNVNSSATVTIGTVSPDSPVAGQPVSLTLTVTPSTTGASISGVTVNWGDGSATQALGAVSGATTLSHTYAASGTFTVTATATDSNGDSFPSTSQITIAARAPANLTVVADLSNPQVGQLVKFTIATTFPTGNTALVQSVSIDYGDGTGDVLGTQSTATAQHVYQTSGTYRVTATVRDTLGSSTSSTTTVVVSPRAALTVTITAPTPSPAGSATAFTIAASIPSTAPAGTTITSIVVDYGDGTQQTFAGNVTSVQHVYAQSGTYVATVTATDSTSATGRGSVSFFVPAPVVASFTFSPQNPPVATDVTFNASASTPSSGNTITKYEWTFGDPGSGNNNSATGITATHKFTSVGTFPVTLTVTDSGSKTAQTIKNVTVTLPQ